MCGRRLVLAAMALVGHGSQALESQLDCPGGFDGDWIFYEPEGKCYHLSAVSHEFDHCNKKYCPEAAGAGTGASSTLVCVKNGAMNDFIYGLGVGTTATWLGMYQRSNREADAGWDRQSAESCDSTWTKWVKYDGRNAEPNDYGGCAEDCAIMGHEVKDARGRGRDLSFKEEWVDVDCGSEARCACEFPSELDASYSAPDEAGVCAWDSILKWLLMLSLITFGLTLGLLTVIFVANRPPKPLESSGPSTSGEVTNPLVALLPFLQTSTPGPHKGDAIVLRLESRAIARVERTNERASTFRDHEERCSPRGSTLAQSPCHSRESSGTSGTS